MNNHLQLRDRGREAMLRRIEAIGWAAARDEFNAKHKPGQSFVGTEAEFSFARGEFDALSDRMPSRAQEVA